MFESFPLMRKATISDFKGASFNPSTIIESASEYNLEEPVKTLDEISNTCFELESLNEAIFFKKEKMKLSLNEQKEQMLNDLCRELKTALNEIDIKEHSRTTEILARRKELMELRTLSKIMKYSLSIEKSELQILESLFKSEDADDWLLLAETVQVQINYGTGDKSNFLIFSKKLEEKITDIFQNALENDNISMCKSCFEILTIIDKQFALIDVFLFSTGLLNTNINVYPKPITSIDLTIDVLKDTTFDQLLKDIIKTLEDKYMVICQVFGLSDEYTEYIYSRITKTLISMNLGNFLNVTNPAIFLLCLQTAYSNMISFGNIIKTLFPKVDFELSLTEIFNQFIYKATIKEIQLFDEILEIYISGAKSLNNYSIDCIKVAKSSNYVRIYENMFILIDSFLNRKELFYTDENEVEVLTFCSKKLCLLVDKVISSEKDEWNAFHSLFSMYLLNKKFLGDKFILFESCNNKIIECVEQEFENIFGSIKMFLKAEIANMFFVEENAHNKLLIYLRNFYTKSTELGERNRKILFYKIFDVLYGLIYTQIQHISFDSKRLANIKKCLDDLSGYFTVNVSSSLGSKLNHLKAMCELINMNYDEFKLVMAKNKSIFTDKEYRDILKCRDDKKSQKNK